MLRDQLKQYVTMIQAQDLHSQPQQEDEQLPTPTEENSRDLSNASAMEEHLQGKLSEVSSAYQMSLLLRDVVLSQPRISVSL